MNCIRNRSLKIDSGQTAPSEMTAVTKGRSQMLCGKVDLTANLPFEWWLFGQSSIPFFSLSLNDFTRKQHCGGSYVFGRILGEPSKRLHLLFGAILTGKEAIERIAGGDRGKKQTGTFHLYLELGVRVVVYPNSTLRLGSWGEAKSCCLSTMSTVSTRDLDVWTPGRGSWTQSPANHRNC